ncbi:MAG TPA: ferric iron uptake transcriptional regulator [Halothiobacillaceae bacterium]|nr:ferric iron uptake transcriptional regulator [Halothiobacillaceae bacterium]
MQRFLQRFLGCRHLRLQCPAATIRTQSRADVLEPSELKKAGLKVTLPRVKILEIIEANPDWHMSAEDVYKELLARGEEIGLATVYRVLTQFETADILKRHQFEGGKAVFELISKGDHDHLVCVKTGQVEEFHDPIIQERIAKIADEFEFNLTDYSLVIYGISRKATGQK